jgi:hypothetical protein
MFRDLGRSEASDASEGKSCHDVPREVWAESSIVGELKVYTKRWEYILASYGRHEERKSISHNTQNNNTQQLITATRL